MAQLPDYARLAFECPMRWEKMARVARGQAPNGEPGEKRFCGECREHVHDLSAMTRTQAERFVAETGGRACVSFECREDQGVVHLPEVPVWAGVVAIGLAACGSPAQTEIVAQGTEEGTEACAEASALDNPEGGVVQAPGRRIAGIPRPHRVNEGPGADLVVTFSGSEPAVIHANCPSGYRDRAAFLDGVATMKRLPQAECACSFRQPPAAAGPTFPCSGGQSLSCSAHEGAVRCDPKE
jgi:hypothetical protein